MKRIGILGHVGNENLGDESIIEAVIQNIRRRLPDVEIIGLTLNAEDTAARHGILSFPIRRVKGGSQAASSGEGSTKSEQPTDSTLRNRMKELLKKIPILFAVARGLSTALEAVSDIAREVPFLLECRRRVNGLDLLIVAGSQQLNDFVGGPWAFPYTVLKWTLLAKAAGAKVVFLSLGAGPIDSWLGRRFIRHALELASYRSYRDVTAKRVVGSLHLSQEDEVVADLAFSLDTPVESTRADRAGVRVVGINPLPLYTDYWYLTDFDKYGTYVSKLATFADWLVDRGCEVRFIPTQLKVDPAVIVDIRKRMVTNGRPECRSLIVEPAIESLKDLRSAISELDVMVATRYHAIVLSLALHKPVLAIAYQDKSRDLMNWLKLGEYVTEGDSFSVEALKERILLLEKEGDSIATSLRQQIPEFQSAVQSQYDEVLSLMDPHFRSC